ncbi:MAG TPA: hypothetical protein PK828_05405 [Limnochordia bacterium]|nr:hypothetical protein [Limnochordia bacterium]HXK97292.1 hypothetical protein [Limnochordia bacterium]
MEQLRGKISGNVKAKKAGKAEIQISGAGDINAEGVTARTADINCRGACDIVLGRVIEVSIRSTAGIRRSESSSEDKLSAYISQAAAQYK